MSSVQQEDETNGPLDPFTLREMSRKAMEHPTAPEILEQLEKFKMRQHPPLELGKDG